jgi:azurin
MLLHSLLISALTFAATAAEAATCELTIDSNDTMAFSTNELVVPAGCKEIKLSLKHSGSLAATIMGHNWVLTETANFEALSKATLNADAADGYLPRNDARVIAQTKLIGGGQSTSITFSATKLKKDGDYTFFCAYPGHWSMMKGKLVVR